MRSSGPTGRRERAPGRRAGWLSWSMAGLAVVAVIAATFWTIWVL
ncbi:MAG: hypothetical protein QNJ12_14415 [Ilumatobacter sp.]|nr:hypothetical protein [Ilumatobacter sp.]MDJ0769991.1 hypothetical protein [Ilumatobacter sp.]